MCNPVTPMKPKTRHKRRCSSTAEGLQYPQLEDVRKCCFRWISCETFSLTYKKPTTHTHTHTKKKFQRWTRQAKSSLDVQGCNTFKQVRGKRFHPVLLVMQRVCCDPLQNFSFHSSLSHPICQQILSVQPLRHIPAYSEPNPCSYYQH